MFDVVQRRLTSGTNIAIFPEGTCHSTPEIKELKLGTARIALQVAAAGGPRIPIIPVGICYSHLSGAKFRGSVLVDVGRPVLVTDELLEMYKTGDKLAMAEAEHVITERLERHLRFVTINMPDWTEKLTELCVDQHLPTPTYFLNSRPRIGSRQQPDSTSTSRDDGRFRHTQSVSVAVGGDTFTSATVLESKSDKRRRLAGQPPRLPVELKRQAARAAFFALNSAADSSFAMAPDAEIVDTMHLARRIYKPTGVPLTLGQCVTPAHAYPTPCFAFTLTRVPCPRYAALTRNFINGALSRAGEPAFIRLWDRIMEYRAGLESLGVSDKYALVLYAALCSFAPPLTPPVWHHQVREPACRGVRRRRNTAPHAACWGTDGALEACGDHSAGRGGHRDPRTHRCAVGVRRTLHGSHRRGRSQC